MEWFWGCKFFTKRFIERSEWCTEWHRPYSASSQPIWPCPDIFALENMKPVNLHNANTSDGRVSWKRMDRECVNLHPSTYQQQAAEIERWISVRTSTNSWAWKLKWRSAMRVHNIPQSSDNNIKWNCFELMTRITWSTYGPIYSIFLYLSKLSLHSRYGRKIE